MRLEKLNPGDIIDTKHITEVSELTGEVISYSKEVYSDEGQQKLDNNKKLKVSQNELHKFLNEDVGKFFFYFYNKLEEYDISPQNKVRFLYLASYLDYDNGDIINKGQFNIKLRMNRQNLMDILLLKDREFRNTLSALVNNNLLIRDTKYYKINTDCVSKGSLPNKSANYTRVFIDTIRELYVKCDPKSHKQLYYIFKLLPYINFQYNIPCTNNDCEILGDIIPLSMKDMCEIVGYDSTSTTKLWNGLRKFKIQDNYVVCKHVVDDLEFICINPRLFYAGTRIEDISYIIGVFDMAKNNMTRKVMPI